MDKKRNTAYIFMPALIEYNDIFTVLKNLDASGSWTQTDTKIKYMLKYVVNKFDRSNPDKCQCFHYELNESFDTEFETEEHKFYDKNVKFGFKISGVHLYCFRTGVMIFALKVEFSESDPYYISAAEYHLKKVSKEKIYLKNSEAAPLTLLDMVKNTVREISDANKFDFFHYANETTERANVLTYVEVESKEDYTKELFYLRRCYRENVSYSADFLADENSVYSPSDGVNWGISSEAAVCLVCSELSGKEFVETKLYPNFNEQYLFMYILLLHQKYVLYTYLTQIDMNMYNSLKKLEYYKEKLYAFETEFVFSAVAEVPQYQKLYEKMKNSFALESLFSDVREPILALGEMRAKKGESKMNWILFIIAVLSLVSAFTDGWELIKLFFK